MPFLFGVFTGIAITVLYREYKIVKELEQQYDD